MSYRGLSEASICAKRGRDCGFRQIFEVSLTLIVALNSRRGQMQQAELLEYHVCHSFNFMSISNGSRVETGR